MKIREKIMLKLGIGNVFKNVSWILIQNIYTMMLGIILTGIVARYYGTSGYGNINFALSFVALFSFIAIFGTNHIIIKDLSENKIDKNIVLGSNLFVRIILSILALIVSQTISMVLYDRRVNLIILLFNINTILCSFDIIVYYAQSLLQNKGISISKMISVTIFSILKLLVIILNLSIEYYVFTYIIETIIYSIFLFVLYKKISTEPIKNWKIDIKYIKSLLEKGKYYAFSALMVTIYLKIDQVMLGMFFEDKSQAGIYSAAVRISEIWTFVPLSIITSYKPIIIASKKNNNSEYDRNLSKLYNIVSLVCFVFCIGFILFGNFGIYILYGKEYMDAYIPLIILTLGTWIGVLGNIHYIWMTCENKEKYSLFYSFCGCITNIIFNVILIPKYGITGAAVATFISQLFSNIVSFLLLKDTKVLSKRLIKSLNIYNGITEIVKKGNKYEKKLFKKTAKDRT